jgi:hypothetical protein
MSLKGFVIIHQPVISEDRRRGAKYPRSNADRVTEISQQCAMWLIHFQAPALALDTFRLGLRDRDHAAVMPAARDFVAGCWVIGKKNGGSNHALDPPHGF